MSVTQQLASTFDLSCVCALRELPPVPGLEGTAAEGWGFGR